MSLHIIPYTVCIFESQNGTLTMIEVQWLSPLHIFLDVHSVVYKSIVIKIGICIFLMLSEKTSFISQDPRYK